MRVILSRKGFDSTIGGYPSPIINGTPFSLPIPDSEDEIRYSDLRFNGKNYLEIMQGLGIETYLEGGLRKPLNENSACHLDPDLRFDIPDNRICPNDWKGSLGQISQAQRHLENQGVGIGDLFLFFGWFRETENKDGKIIYKRNLEYPNGFHLIYGYLRIGEIIKTADQDCPAWLANHPHNSREDVRSDPSNAIYLAKEKPAKEADQAEFGIFPFSEKLILTKTGESKSRWDKKKLKGLEGLKITYHSKTSWKKDYFQSAGRGQEFVIEENKKAVNWALKFFQ